MVEQKSKKFVFTILSENSDYVESLSYEQKNSLINKLLSEYRANRSVAEKNENLINFIKKMAIIMGIILIGTPILVMGINFCFNATIKGYSQMQKNFERLFDE